MLARLGLRSRSARVRAPGLFGRKRRLVPSPAWLIFMAHSPRPCTVGEIQTAQPEVIPIPPLRFSATYPVTTSRRRKTAPPVQDPHQSIPMKTKYPVVSASSALLWVLFLPAMTSAQHVEPALVSATKEARLILLAPPVKMVDPRAQSRPEEERFGAARLGRVKFTTIVPRFSAPSPADEKKRNTAPAPTPVTLPATHESRRP